MACKVKVGDKVRLVDRRPQGWNHDGEMDCFLGKVVTVKRFLYSTYTLFAIEENPKWTFHVNDVVEVITVSTEPELHITVKGRETIGVYKHDGKTDKAVAKCSPEDTFDFATGVKLVCERLGVLPTEPVEPVEPVEKLNWKCVCVKSDLRFWTVGKIYESVNGIVRDDEGDPRDYKTFEKFNEKISLDTNSSVRFVKLVE